MLHTLFHEYQRGIFWRFICQFISFLRKGSSYRTFFLSKVYRKTLFFSAWTLVWVPLTSHLDWYIWYDGIPSHLLDVLLSNKLLRSTSRSKIRPALNKMHSRSPHHFYFTSTLISYIFNYIIEMSTTKTPIFLNKNSPNIAQLKNGAYFRWWIYVEFLPMWIKILYCSLISKDDEGEDIIC